MLESLLGSINRERVLIYLQCREEGYAREIAPFFDASLYAIQKQLDKFEQGGILISKKVGRTRLYMFNPRYPFLNELKTLTLRSRNILRLWTFTGKCLVRNMKKQQWGTIILVLYITIWERIPPPWNI